jgi:hypothetical protein
VIAPDGARAGARFALTLAAGLGEMERLANVVAWEAAGFAYRLDHCSAV